MECPAGQTFCGSMCLCPSGQYVQDDGSCSPCSDNCNKCRSDGCRKCKRGYFLRRGACVACPDNCRRCISENRCRRCDDGYGLQNGRCVTCEYAPYRFPALYASDDENTIVECRAGCASCTEDRTCVEPEDGFAVVQGRAQKCADNCEDCARTNPNICLECADGYSLVE